MTNYDFNIHARPTLLPQELEDLLDGICRNVTAQQGTIYRKGISELTPLTRPVNGYDQGYHLYVNFSVEASRIEDIEASLPDSEDILNRYVLNLDDVNVARKY